MERGLEFYVMLAVVAVGALTWLYRKGSRVWRTVRKLRRSFQEICLNPKSTLADEPCRQLAIGAMYASQQGAWQNSLETGIFDTLPEILGGWWGIDSTAEARDQLDYLCEKGFRYYWPTVLEAFRLDGPYHLRVGGKRLHAQHLLEIERSVDERSEFAVECVDLFGRPRSASGQRGDFQRCHGIGLTLVNGYLFPVLRLPPSPGGYSDGYIRTRRSNCACRGH